MNLEMKKTGMEAETNFKSVRNLKKDLTDRVSCTDSNLKRCSGRLSAFEGESKDALLNLEK